MRSYAQQRDPTRTAIGFVIVVVLHLALIYSLVNGLGHRLVDVIKGPLVTKIIPQVKPPATKPPPPPPPDLVKPPPPYIPPPLVNVEAPPSENTITRVTTAPPPAVPAFKPAPPAPPVADTNVAPQSISGELPAYPDSLIDDDIEGTATIRCDVEADGTTSNCSIVGVTGSAQFGSTALDFVRTHKLRPATHNGLPVRTPGAIIPYRFKLTDAQ